MTEPKVCITKKRSTLEWIAIVLGVTAATITILRTIGLPLGTVAAGVPDKSETGALTVQGLFVLLMAALLMFMSIKLYFTRRQQK